MKVSVIIPCYNVENYISDCLDSVIRQTYSNIEIILVDNNSIDQTPFLLKKYQEKYPDLIQVHQESKQGAPAARNKGLIVAKGEWIQFLDADDQILPDKLNNQLNLVSGTASTLVIGAYRYQFSNDKSQDIYPDDQHHLYIALLRGYLGITVANLWNKQSLLSLNGWDESLPSNQEYDLLFRLFQHNTHFVFDCNIQTVVYRREQSISTHIHQQDNWEGLIRQRMQILDYIKKENPLIYTANQSLINEYLISVIFALARYDVNKARIYYDLIFSTHQKIRSNDYGKSIKYLYNILGLERGSYLYCGYLRILKLMGRYSY